MPGWYWVRHGEYGDFVTEIGQDEIDRRHVDAPWGIMDFESCKFAPCPKPEGWKE